MILPSYDVLSYGTIGLDNILRLPHLPRPDIGTHTLDQSWHLGGKATNTAALLATWGLKVAISGHTIGDDDIGVRLLNILACYPNISTRYLTRQAGLQSMHCIILVTPDGERAIIGVNVEGNLQTPPTLEMVQDARLLTLDLYGGEERVEIAHLAYDAGLPVIVGDLRHTDHPVLPYTTVAIASAAEIRSGYPNLSLNDYARAVQKSGASHTIVTDGPSDVWVFEAGGAAVVIRPPSVPVVDTTGAGDAFRAGVVFGVLSGFSLVESAALGVAAGSLSVGYLGAASNPPSLAEVKSVAQALTRRTS